MPKQPQAPGPAPEPAPDITLIAAMGLTVMPRIRLADDIAEIAAQVDRARDAAGRLRHREGGRSLARQLFALERAVRELEAARQAMAEHALEAARLAEVVAADGDDPRTWLMHRQAAAIDRIHATPQHPETAENPSW